MTWLGQRRYRMACPLELQTCGVCFWIYNDILYWLEFSRQTSWLRQTLDVLWTKTFCLKMCCMIFYPEERTWKKNVLSDVSHGRAAMMWVRIMSTPDQRWLWTGTPESSSDQFLWKLAAPAPFTGVVLFVGRSTKNICSAWGSQETRWNPIQAPNDSFSKPWREQAIAEG
jgi:hypothetical protein